jgi:peptidoglycan hydrolase CwlO-like protein
LLLLRWCSRTVADACFVSTTSTSNATDASNSQKHRPRSLDGRRTSAAVSMLTSGRVHGRCRSIEHGQIIVKAVPMLEKGKIQWRLSTERNKPNRINQKIDNYQNEINELASQINTTRQFKITYLWGEICPDKNVALNAKLKYHSEYRVDIRAGTAMSHFNVSFLIFRL